MQNRQVLVLWLILESKDIRFAATPVLYNVTMRPIHLFAYLSGTNPHHEYHSAQRARNSARRPRSLSQCPPALRLPTRVICWRNSYCNETALDDRTTKAQSAPRLNCQVRHLAVVCAFVMHEKARCSIRLRNTRSL